MRVLHGNYIECTSCDCVGAPITIENPLVFAVMYLTVINLSHSAIYKYCIVIAHAQNVLN